MKFNPNKHKTLQDTQLALIDQGYGHPGNEDVIDTHPVTQQFDPATGELISEVKAEPEVVEPAPEQKRLSIDKIHRIAEIAVGPMFDSQGRQVFPDEVADIRRDITSK